MIKLTMTGSATIDLVYYLKSHEDDIAADRGDYGQLRKVYIEVFGGAPDVLEEDLSEQTLAEYMLITDGFKLRRFPRYQSIPNGWDPVVTHDSIGRLLADLRAIDIYQEGE